MFIVLGSKQFTLILSQNYYSNISRQLLNSFKTLTIYNLGFSTFKIERPLANSVKGWGYIHNSASAISV